jgi:ABC-type multidrug transport system fused ATPase/permease subunit
MFAWEDNFSANIGVHRTGELNLLRRIAYLRGFSRAYMTALPGLVAVASFVVLSVANTRDIKASTLFSALVAFDQLRFPLLFYPVALAQLAQAKVSAARVQTFLELPQVGDQNLLTENGETTSSQDTASKTKGVYVRKLTTGVGGSIVLDGATIYWNDPEVPLEETQHSRKSVQNSNADTDLESITKPRYAKPILNKISMSVQPGQLCAVSTSLTTFTQHWIQR